MQKKIYDSKSGRILYLMRGLPGSGKSNLAKRLTKNVFSTDDYFIKNGKYEFDFEQIEQAHEWNQQRVEDELKLGTKKIAVDNTNTSAWEMTPYVRLAMRYDYNIVLVEPDTGYKWDVDILLSKTKHNVSKDKMQLMLDCYDHDPSLEDILKTEKD